MNVCKYNAESVVCVMRVQGIGRAGAVWTIALLHLQVRVYLLERSRCVKIASPERTYHIFYQMLAGCDDEQKERYK